MIWPPPAEQGATAFVGAPSTADNLSSWNTRLARDGDLVSACGVAPTTKKGKTIMELLRSTPPRRPTC
jgi:hypothetical protein